MVRSTHWSASNCFLLFLLTQFLSDETGWAWYIPLHKGRVSVGVVVSETSHRTKKEQQPDLKAHYLSQLQLTPGLVKLLGDARLVSDIKSAGDYSYSASGNQYAGPNFRIAGDAGGQIEIPL
jgi:flavin-dependent dehydrogenase